MHIKRERLKRLNYDAQFTKWAKKHRVTKPLLGGRTPNRVKIMDAHTLAVLAGVCGMSVKDFAEMYD